MIRRFIIASLVLASLGLAIVGAMSFSRPIVTSFRITSRHWLTGAVYDGRARLFWLTTKEESILDVRRDKGARILITSTWCQGVNEPYFEAKLLTISSSISLGSTRDVPGFGGAFRSDLPVSSMEAKNVTISGQWGTPNIAAPWVVTNSYVRAPIAVLVAAMLIYPTLAYIRGPLRERRRRRSGCCLQCGYSLFALTGTKCPECGADIPSTNVTILPSFVAIDAKDDAGDSN